MKVQTTWSGSRRGSNARRYMERAARAVALIVIAACSEDPQQITYPSLPGLRFGFRDGGHGGGVVGGNSHTVVVCVDISSPSWTYIFATTLNANSDPLELPTSNDPDYLWPHTTGPYSPGDAIIAAVSITLPGVNCKSVFVRDRTVTDENNRIWVLPDGIWNPDATVDVTLDVPPGFTYVAKCTNDDPTLVQTVNCSSSAGVVANPITTSANIYNGSDVTYFITATPAAMIGALRVTLSTLELRHGTVHSLDHKLLAALKALDKGKTSHACTELDRFIKQLGEHEGKKFDDADAADLISKASEILTALGC
jgi:hypothetical protein